ncbi:MAG: L-ribulose-5-phosphate 4-epimerase [Clostridiales bacterium]|nr:L-ribulose-5-phosphate 4-epimerase [Clostridiales bacterium]
MLEELKEKVFQANLRLVEYGLVVLTWGNVSGIDREEGLFVIKPSGVPYDNMKASDMVVVDLDGNKVEGDLNPSSDTPTHAYLYRHFDDIGGVVHTHSSWACSWAQAGRDIPAYGTTHADFANTGVPCARGLTVQEVNSAYEYNTGKVIVKEFSNRGLKASECPAVLVHRHGPFTWGSQPFKAVENALILEEVARMAYQTEQMSAFDSSANIGIEQYLLDKHYQRKHGKNAYYGQNKGV